ncbi:MAG TPA: peptidase M16 [Planctomycetes bacterium]|nr:peptidase M16 [Planctomycetota bacterium]
MRVRGAWIAGILWLAAAACPAQNLAEIEKKLTKFTLPNGLTAIVFERRQAPVVSCVTCANVGSVDEVKGITGIAHIFEHMAFKGTSRIGTTDHAAEAAALARADKAFLALKEERRKGPRADAARIAALQEEFRAAQEEAENYIVPDEFDKAIEAGGSPDLNAFTSEDATCYLCSLPANKLELWMALESERFRDPVLREFYKERDVITEERRLGENDPQQRLFEDFQSTAFKAHPYGEPVIGHMSDVRTITRQEAERWFATYYRASNLTVALVGDVDPAAARVLVETYFGRLPRGEKPEPVETVEPPQDGERRCTIEAPAEPLLLVGYHRPAVQDPESPALDVLADILGEGRTSRLYRALVKEQKLAADAGAWAYGVGGKYPSLLVVSVVPAQGRTTAENEQALYAEIDRLAKEPPAPEELEKAKANVRAVLLRRLRSNMGLAIGLALQEAATGNWRDIFTRAEKIEKVTAEEVRKAAATYLTARNRTVGTLQREP